MTAIRFAISIALGLVATTSAFAQPKAVATPTPVTIAAASTAALPLTITLAAGPAAAAYKASPNARYCFRTQHSGSILRKTVCKTRSDWQASGVDFDAALTGR